jgi:hypothetical protein
LPRQKYDGQPSHSKTMSPYSLVIMAACLISFGRRWRSDAQAALTALGLEVPTGEESGS